MQADLNENILFLYGKLMFKFTSLENILKRLVFLAQQKENMCKIDNLNLNIDWFWDQFNKPKMFKVGQIDQYKQLLFNRDFFNNEIFNEDDLVTIKNLYKTRNKIAHNFNMIAAYDSNNQLFLDEINKKTEDFNNDCNAAELKINPLIIKSKNILNQLEIEFEQQGVRFNYYNYEKN